MDMILYGFVVITEDTILYDSVLSVSDLGACLKDYYIHINVLNWDVRVVGMGFRCNVSFCRCNRLRCPRLDCPPAC